MGIIIKAIWYPSDNSCSLVNFHAKKYSETLFNDIFMQCTKNPVKNCFDRKMRFINYGLCIVVQLNYNSCCEHPESE